MQCFLCLFSLNPKVRRTMGPKQVIWVQRFFVSFLKALSMLLNGSPFVFVIDLAALASRREYLKLDKWLKDKLKEHQVK